MVLIQHYIISLLFPRIFSEQLLQGGGHDELLPDQSAEAGRQRDQHQGRAPGGSAVLATRRLHRPLTARPARPVTQDS